MAILKMLKPIPDNEQDRVAESYRLLAKIQPEDVASMTTWEREMVEEIKQGRAVTRIRLKELREMVERIHPTR